MPPTEPRDAHHFGFEAVDAAEKTQRVDAVFSSVAHRYDVMNDVMSWGLHRRWKRHLLVKMQVQPTDRVLDAAAGTGDISARLIQRIDQGEVVLLDMNQDMLLGGRKRLLDQGLVQRLRFVQGNLEALPFAHHQFDKMVVAFGLRNVTHMDRALRSCHRVLKPGGAFYCLEFSQPEAWLQPGYDRYSFDWLPWLGQQVVGDAASYRYLAESIRMHPNQQQLVERMQRAGFEGVSFEDLCAGVVALHWGYKS